MNASHVAFKSACVNIFMAVVKVVAGIIGNSFALIADGIESITDVFSSAIVWKGLQISEQAPDIDHPYGHGKAESISGLIASLGLFASASFIAYQSIQSFQETKAPPTIIALIVIIFVIISKFGFYLYSKRKAIQFNSTALDVESYHHFSDLMTSIAVLIGVFISYFGGDHYLHADSIAALVICLFIYWNSYKLARPCIQELMDEVASEEVYQSVKDVANSVDGIQDIETLIIRKSGNAYLVDIHLEVDPSISVREGHEISHNCKDKILEMKTYNITHVLCHIEPYDGEIK